MPALSSIQWQTVRGAVAALLTFLLVTQTDVTLPPLAKVIMGAALVVLAFLGKSEPANSA